jgi:spermidine synthase
VLVILSALASVIMFGAAAGGWRAHRAAGEWVAAAGALLVVAVAFIVVPGVPTRLVAFGRNAWRVEQMPRTLYVGEGRNASVAVLEREDGVRSFHVSGKVEASSEPQDMRLQRLLAHLGALVHPHPRSVLVVGFGAGVTAGTFLMHPDVERIVICEIEPLIPGHVGPLFARENLGVLDDPRVQIVYDDARHFLRTTTERFDVITSDPIHPWVKGAASLYTAEYFHLLRERLAPGGVITNWLPLYETSEDAARSAIGTFLEAVPNGTVWNTRSVSGRGFDAILLGQEGPTVIDVPALQRRLMLPENQAVLHSLVTLGYGSPLDLFANFLGTRVTLARWLAPAQINRDRNLRLQFLAGRAAWGMEQEDIIRSMSATRVLPPGLFSADTAWLRALRDTLAASAR